MNNNLEGIIEKLSSEFPFVTEEQKNKVREEYKDTDKKDSVIEHELLVKIKDYVVQKSQIEFIPITDYVSYHKSNDTIHLHLTIEKLSNNMRDIINTYGKDMAREKYNEFLTETLSDSLFIVSDMMKEDESINKVSATSTLVEKYQDLFVKEGFEVKQFNDMELSNIFPNKSLEERENFRYNATMSRDKVLNNYSNIENTNSNSI